MPWASALPRRGLEVVADDRQLSGLPLLSLDDVPRGPSRAVDAFYARGHFERLQHEFAQGVGVVDGFAVVVGRLAHCPNSLS